MLKKLGRKSLGLVILLTGAISLTSCNNSNNDDPQYSDSVQEFIDFSNKFTFSVDAGPDKITSDLKSEELVSTDDTIYITSYKGDESEVVVPESVRDVIKVVGIKDKGFSNNSNITKITLPSTIETIEGKSFNNISNLKEMNLPTETVVEPKAFDGTNYLINTYVKETSNDSGLYVVNSNLYSVDNDISGNVVIPDYITSIPDSLFKDKNITSVVFSQNLETIGDSAFYNTDLSTVQLPDSVMEIGNSAFAKNESLTSFYAFDIKNESTEVNEVKYGSSVLANCPNLTEVAFSGNVTLKDLTNASTKKDSDYYDSKIETVYLNSKSIKDKCLLNFDSIKEVHLMNSVIVTGKNAFTNMPNLTTFTPNSYNPKSNLSYITPDDPVKEGEEDKDLSFFETEAYRNAVSSIVDDYVIFGSAIVEQKGAVTPTKLNGKQIKGYPDEIFKDNKTITDSFLQSIGIENALYFGASSFEGTNISQLDISNNGYFIASNAFANCENLTSVKLSDNTTLQDNAFSGDYGIKELSGNVTKSLSSLIGKATSQKQYQLEKVELSDNVVDIVQAQFKDATKLKTIKYSENLVSVGFQAFFNCKSLTEFHIPYSTTSIGDNAFGLCTSLKNVTIVDTHVSGTDSDSYNTNDSVRAPGGIPNRIAFGAGAFFGCTSLPESFSLPFRVKALGGAIFTNSSVKEIVLHFTDYDRRYNNDVEHMNPATDIVSSIDIQPGFNQGFEIGEDSNPVLIKTVIKGVGTYFTGGKK